MTSSLFRQRHQRRLEQVTLHVLEQGGNNLEHVRPEGAISVTKMLWIARTW
jgi:hypothetical protein